MNYKDLGFDEYMTRPISRDVSGNRQSTLLFEGLTEGVSGNQVEKGTIGNVLNIGNIELDGVNGKIAVKDNGRTTIYIGPKDEI